jgi:hypothetical protein
MSHKVTTDSGYSLLLDTAAYVTFRLHRGQHDRPSTCTSAAYFAWCDELASELLRDLAHHELEPMHRKSRLPKFSCQTVHLQAPKKERRYQVVATAARLPPAMAICSLPPGSERSGVLLRLPCLQAFTHSSSGPQHRFARPRFLAHRMTRCHPSARSPRTSLLSIRHHHPPQHYHFE